MVKLKKLVAVMLAVAALMAQCVVGYANSGVSGSAALDTLTKAAGSKTGGTETQLGTDGKAVTYGGPAWDYSKKTYTCQDGGYKLYEELTSKDVNKPINESALATLTSESKDEFLTDYFNAGQNVLNWVESSGNTQNTGITPEVGTMWLQCLQKTNGMGSQLMTTLLAQTKPDYIRANEIYKPFSGLVGTILGIMSVLLMAFLAITMVLDLSYIAIPAFQLFVDGDGKGGQGGESKKSFISREAIDAVKQAGNNGGQGGQDGGTGKLAVMVYFKKRVLMLMALGICLLYLVSGNIFSFVGWFVDLFSGIVGF